MKKFLSLIIASICFVLPNKAQADYDIADDVLLYLDIFNKGIEAGVKEIDTELEKYRDLSKMNPANVIGVNEFYEMMPKVPKVDLTIPMSLEDLTDTEKTLEDIQLKQTSQISLETKDTAQAALKEYYDHQTLVRKNFTDLYAKAFTTRTNIAREKEPDLERKTTQSMLKSSSVVDNRVITRLNNIRLLNLTYAEFVYNNKLYALRNPDAGTTSSEGEK
ncbi:MAG: hypothetical protein PHE89_02315 [Alphaproteobacteria bacterium]|nr:hypothetical protein [Alphaproteobacteria bacterium]